MARWNPLWQQALTYPASVDRALLAAIWPGGGASGARPSAVANTLNITVPAGMAAVPLTDGTAAMCRWDAPETVTCNPGPGAGTSRIDLVVVTVRDSALSGTNNDFVVQVLSGTPAASPVPPNVTANSYVLTQVLVPANAANLNAATLTDRRAPLVPSGLVTRVARTTAFSFTNTRSVLPFNVVTEDPAAAYNSTSGLYTCPAPGLYRVSAHFSATLAAGAASDLAVNKSGTSAFVTMGGLTGSASVAGRILGNSGPIRCVAGDTLGVEIWANNTLAGVVGAAGLNWATFEFVGP